MGIVPNELEGAIVTNDFLLFDFDKKEIDLQYFTYLTSTRWFDKECKLASEGATNRVRLKVEKFLSIYIPLPSLPIQRKIVEKLQMVESRCGKAIQLRLLAEKEVEALQKTLYNEKFIELTNTYENIEVGKILTLSSGDGITREFINKHSGEYAVYGGGGFIGRISKYFIEEETIAIGRVGARCGCIFKTEKKSWVSDNALYVTELKREMNLEYLVFVLSLLDLRKRASQTAQPVISQSKVYPQLIPIPSTIKEQKEILTELKSVTNKIHQIKIHQQLTSVELKALFPSVLDKAFKGEG